MPLTGNQNKTSDMTFRILILYDTVLISYFLEEYMFDDGIYRGLSDCNEDLYGVTLERKK